MKRFPLPAALCLPVLLAACATSAPAPELASIAPPQWQAPLPHEGSVNGLSQWWQRQGDPLLAQLIDAAQAASPTIAAAKSRIEQARATQVNAGAAFLPAVGATVNATRTRTAPGAPLTTVTQAGGQASWEIDLFGAGRAGQRAAAARMEGAQAGWHDARVSVAAEVANQYYNLRSCQLLLDISRSDAASRAETSRLAQLSAGAGFQAPATAALARASAAEGNARVTQQAAQCDLNIKALVALSAISEPVLREQLAQAKPVMPQTADMAITALPAQTLAQRPDVFNAEREVAAASAEIDGARAQRYPRLALTGFVGAVGVGGVGGASANTGYAHAWSIGPATLTIPLFDGGSVAANIDAAKARYEAAVAQYQASVRQAVREVEEALVNLDSTAARSNDARIAVDGYRASFEGTQSRYQTGLANLIELEEARRTRLAAEVALVSLQRERIAAWISLYRAAGGGWSRAEQAASASSASATPNATSRN